MLKPLFASASLFALTALVGCTAEPVALEEKGESASRQSTGDLDAQAKRDLDRLEAKAMECGVFTDDEERLIEVYRGHVDWTFEAYVSFTCTYERGVLGIANTVTSNNFGWSSSDRFFGERTYAGNLSATIPLRYVDANVSASKTLSIRQSEMGFEAEVEDAFTVGASRELRRDIVASVDVEVAEDKVSVSAGTMATVPLTPFQCDGKKEIGLVLKLGAEQVRTVSRALQDRANEVHSLNHLNYLSRREQERKGEGFCCAMADECGDDF